MRYGRDDMMKPEKKTMEDIIDEIMIVTDEMKVIIGMRGTAGTRPVVYERIYDATRSVVENNEYPTKNPYRLYNNLRRKYLSILKRK